MNKNLNNPARCSCARLVIKKNISLPHLKSKYPKFPLTVTDLYFFSYQPLPCVVSDCFSLPFFSLLFLFSFCNDSYQSLREATCGEQYPAVCKFLDLPPTKATTATTKTQLGIFAWINNADDAVEARVRFTLHRERGGE